MAKIFISYAREDRPKAQQLARVFEDRGWSVWWDTRLRAGEVWDEVIERELTAACCVVVLWSRISVGKHWVRVEANEGLQRRILIDWSGDRSDAGLVRLLAAIGVAWREKATKQTMPPRGPRPARRTGTNGRLAWRFATSRRHGARAWWCCRRGNS